MRGHRIPISILALAAAWPASAQSRGVPPVRTLPRPAAIRPMSVASVSPVTVTPASLAFQAPDPDLGAVSLPVTTVNFSATNSGQDKTWNLSLQAPSAAFLGYPTVPVSAVTVTCSAASASNSGNNGSNATAACGAPFALSASPQVVATGTAANQGSAIAITIAFTFADKWSYVAAVSQPCTLSLTYTATAF